jgi:hypothetical protein
MPAELLARALAAALVSLLILAAWFFSSAR